MIGIRTPLLRLVVATLVLLASGAGALAQTVTWTGGGDGISWNQAANWSSNPSLPGAANDVVIPAGAQQISYNGTNTIRSLSLDRAMIMGGCQLLTITNGLTLPSAAGVLTTGGSFCENLRFNGTQSITGAGEVVIGAGSASVLGTTVLTIGSGVTVRNSTSVSGSLSVASGASIINQGIVRGTGAGRIFTINGASATTTLTNAAGGSIEAVSGGSVTIDACTWTNNGTFLINAGTLNLGGTTGGLGTINRTGGAINFNAAYTSPTLAISIATGNVNLANNAAFTGVTLSATDGQSFTSSGNLSFNNCTLAAPLTLGGCALLTVTNGLSLQGGAVLSTGGSFCENLRFSGPLQSLSGSGEIVIGAGSASISGGSAIVIGAGVTVRNSTSVSGTLGVGAGASLINQGILRGTGAGRSLTIDGVDSSSSLSNSTGGTIEAVNGGSLTIDACSWSNTGALVVNAGTLNLGGTVGSLGTINRTGGTINFNANYLGSTLTASNATGPLNFANGTTFTNTTLNAIDGQTLSTSGAVSFSGCTLGAPITLGGCALLTITNGLTMQAGSSINTGGSFCENLRFSGAAQSISGSGEIVIGAGSASIVGTTTLTIGNGITVRNSTSVSGSLGIAAGATLINQGVLRGTGAGRSFTLSSASATSILTNASGGSIEAINSGSLTIEGITWTNSGTLLVNAGTLNLGGTTSGLGAINRTGGTINFNSNYTSPALTVSNVTGPINFTNGAAFNGTTLNAIDGQSLTTSGNVSFTGCTLAAPLTLGGCALLTVTNGLTLQSGATITTGGSFCENLRFSGPPQSVSGSGEIIIGAGSASLVSATTLTISSGVTVRNSASTSGSLTISAGSTLINQGILRGTGSGRSLTIDGVDATSNLTNAPGGSIEAVNSGTLTITDCTTTNNGTFVVNAGTLNLGGTIAALGTINRTGGTIVLTGSYTGASLILSNATGPITFSNGITFTGTTLGAIDGQVFTLSGAANFSGVTLGAPLTLGGCTILTITNGLTLQGGAVITTGGSFCENLRFSGSPQSVTGSGEIVLAAGSMNLSGATTLTIGSGVTIRNSTSTSGSITMSAGSAFINQGTVRASTAGRSLSITGGAGGGGVFTNAGQLEGLLSAGLVFQNLTIDNSGQITLDPGSVLSLNSGATLNLQSPGRVTFRISGPAAANAGRIAVNAGGTLNIGGAVTIAYVNGYAPTTCTPATTVITTTGAGASTTGTFTGATVPPAPGNLRSAVGYTGANVFFAFTSRADVAALGGALTPDGQLTADDIIAYLNAFFAGNLAVADVAGLGGTPGPDGQLTPDDLIVFLDSFFAGCQ